MAIVKGGHPNFGQILGIIMADTVRPRVPGDPGNASTYPFPVRYLTVSGSTWARFVEGQAEGLLEPFVQAAQELERQGVKAITTSCGLLTDFQETLANSVRIPTFATCLLQVPLLLRMLNKDLKVCVISLVSSRLTDEDLRAVGVEDTSRVIIVGTEHTPYLFESTRSPEFDPDLQRDDLVQVAVEAVERHPEIGAFVLECSSFPAYAPAIHRATGLPVFDINTMATWVASGVVRPKDFDGYL